MLEVRIFGDGSLPFLLETPTGTVQITWNSSNRSGSVRQTGDEKYIVAKWLRSDQTSMVPGVSGV
jgi:hypothetical protein